MDKRLLGIFLAIPSLLVISAMVFWIASHPGEDAEFERISAMPILEKNKYSFKLQREKADAIETFAKSFPNSPKADLLIRYFFDISHSYGLPTARDRGSDLIFAVQLRPYASDPTIDESINNSYAVEKFHQSDPFYKEVKLSAEKLIAMPDQNISTAEKAVRFCGASDEQAWQEKIVDLAWQVASGKKDQDGLTLLSNSIKNVEPNWVSMVICGQAGKHFQQTI